MTQKLMLYSDQRAPLTDAVDARLLELLPKRRPCTVGYVPSAPDPARSWFAQCARHYARHGIALEFLGLEEQRITRCCFTTRRSPFWHRSHWSRRTATRAAPDVGRPAGM